MNTTLIWPLVALLGFLIVLHNVRDAIAPISKGVITGIAANAQKYALSYVLACFLAISASIGAFIDNFGPLDRAAMDGLAWWQIAAVVAKCMNPGIVAIIGFLMKSPLPAPPATSGTQPPFPSPSP